MSQSVEDHQRRIQEQMLDVGGITENGTVG